MRLTQSQNDTLASIRRAFADWDHGSKVKAYTAIALFSGWTEPFYVDGRGYQIDPEWPVAKAIWSRSWWGRNP
jgi:hypothetical protein